jgi:hypothetical protein
VKRGGPIRAKRATPRRRDLSAAAIEDGWPVEFPGYVRELVLARDTPPGFGGPCCVICGTRITGLVHVHHVLFRGRGGDGRPSNGIATHGLCHDQKAHQAGRLALANGWARSQFAARPEVYSSPVLCARRGRIILDDDGGWRPE